MTVLEMVNQLMRRLRETEVTDLTSDYARLLVDFINDTAGEMQDEYDYTQLRTEVAFATVADQREYDISSQANNDSYVIMDGRQNAPMAYFFDDEVTDVNGSSMFQISDEGEYHLFQTDRDGESSSPLWFSLEYTATGPKVRVYPTPAEAGYIRMKMWVPETEFDADTDAATEIRLPERPLFLGALYLALNERGEEMGEPGNVAERRYEKAKARAIATDSKQRGVTNEYEAWRD